MLAFVVSFSHPYQLSAAEEWKITGLFIIAFLIYSAIGVVLIYWTKIQARTSRIPELSDNQ